MSIPYRADHIGSFLRPPDILEARKIGVPPEQRRALEDREILRVLAKQKELGFEIFTDGELRRSTFMSDFVDAVDGFDFGEDANRPWRAGVAEAKPMSIAGIVAAKLHQARRLTGHELPFLKQQSPGAIKMTLPSPTQFPAITWRAGVTDKVYENHSELLTDVTGIIKNECATLAGEGIAYLQIDAPRYSYYIDAKWRDWLRAEMGAEPEALLDEAVKADNACFQAARRPGLINAIHLCRGNNRSQWYAEGGYDAIAEKLFSTLDVDRFLLEYDDPRSGSFDALRFIPKGKIVVLGLVSTKRAPLETADSIVRRIEEAAKIIPLENLTLSPQCGFASTMEGNLLTEEEQWAKLRLVVEVARRVWGSV